ncbi:hypothetical protein D9M73_198990 [compost metagenome]
MIEVKAKKKIAMAMKYCPAQPMCSFIAAWVSGVPVMSGPGTTPDSRIMMAVAVQISNVSMNTPRACTKPCEEGW